MRFFLTLLSILGISYLFLSRRKPGFATAKTRDTLLWELSGGGLPSPSYLVGTMHMMCAEDAVLSAATRKIIRLVDEVYLEADINNAGDILPQMLESANSDNPNLADVLTETEYETVKGFFEQHQPYIPFSILEKQHPLMLSSGLYEVLLDCDEKKGIDMVILEEAQKQRKPVKGLETLAFQASLFKEMSYEQQAKELARSIDSIDAHRSLLQQMMAVYKAQQIDTLHQLATSEHAGTVGLLDILLNNRNTDWVQKIGEIASKRRVLFAVGAGHLGGPDGLVKLLEKQGYQLRPLENNLS